MIKDNSRLGLYDLIISKSGEEFVVGRPDIESYIQVPEYALEIIKLLRDNYSVKETYHAILKSHGKYDIVDFANFLVESGFVKFVDGKHIVDKHQKYIPNMLWIKLHHVKWMFSPVAYLVYLAIIIFATTILFRFPVYFPTFSDFFFHPSLIVITLGSFFVGWILVFKHELAHYFAAVTRGIKGRFTVSNRLYYLVAETDVTNLYQIPIKNRYRVYFAGMFSDYLVFSISVIFLYLIDLSFIPLPQLVYNLFKLVILLETLSILWQFMFFMKTDIYYAFENFFQSESLLDDSMDYIKSKFDKRSVGLEGKALNVVKLYSLFVLIGVPISFIRLVYFHLPILVNLVVTSWTKMTQGVLGSGTFFDGLIFMVFIVADHSFLLYALYKKYKHHAKNPLAEAFFGFFHMERDLFIHTSFSTKIDKRKRKTFRAGLLNK